MSLQSRVGSSRVALPVLQRLHSIPAAAVRHIVPRNKLKTHSAFQSRNRSSQHRSSQSVAPPPPRSSLGATGGVIALLSSLTADIGRTDAPPIKRALLSPLQHENKPAVRTCLTRSEASRRRIKAATRTDADDAGCTSYCSHRKCISNCHFSHAAQP